MRAHNLAGYPRYVWITYAWYQDEWWTSAVNNEPIECSDDELAQLLRQSLAIEVIPVPENPAAETNVGVVRFKHVESISSYCIVLLRCCLTSLYTL